MFTFSEFNRSTVAGLVCALAIELAGGGCARTPSQSTSQLHKPAEIAATTQPSGESYDVRAFGAAGDGKTIDTPAINKAIAAANAAGGGTVRFPAGTYLSASIHLMSDVTLFLDAGSTIEAAGEGVARFDLPEGGTSTRYQDFGHSHWQNSLLWGDGLKNVAIVGTGLIHGKGLSRGYDGRRYTDPPLGVGNKAIALKNCHNVTLRDFSILHGGHFGILATGVDNLTIDNLKIDTNRDGMDIDCCRNVRVTNCSVNSPWDDGICLKTSYALGYIRDTSNVTIDNCYITGGLIEGTMLDGTWKKSPRGYSGRTGRIKFGTESNGGYKNITISNCVFEDTGGLLLESVDGGDIEDITISNIAMREIGNTPIFIRLGSRLRGPDNPPVGTIKRVNISNLVASGVAPNLGSVISGVPGHPIEDLRISNMHILSRGGSTTKPSFTPPEREQAYPDPGMFGSMPSYGMFFRHVRGLQVSDVNIQAEKPDSRPAFYLNDVDDADFRHVKWQPSTDGKSFFLRAVKRFQSVDSPTMADKHVEQSESDDL